MKVRRILALAFIILSTILTFFLFTKPEPVEAWIPAGMSGKVFTRVNGQIVYLTGSKIYREDRYNWSYCNGGACYGYNDGVQTGMGYTEFSMANDSSDYYCSTPDGDGDGIPDGARLCGAGSFQGIPVTPGNACVRQNWCGFNCGMNPHRVKAFLPDIVGGGPWAGRTFKEYMNSLGLPFDENDPSGKGGGTFIARCPVNGDTGSGSCRSGSEPWVDPTTNTTYGPNEYFILTVDNQSSYFDSEFEWIPPSSQPPSCTITANPSTVFGQDTSQLTVSVNDPDSTRATVMWSKAQGTCGSLDTNPDYVNVPGNATSSITFNGNENCESVVVTATVSDGVSNEVGTCTATISPRKPPKCENFNIYQGGENKGKNYTVPNDTTAFNLRLTGYDGDININPDAYPDRLAICWTVANQSESYYRRGEGQSFTCEATDDPTEQGQYAFFQNANKNLNQYISALPSGYLQGLNGTARENGLIFWTNVRDSFYSSTLLACTTNPGWNSGQGTLFKTPEFPGGIPSLYCGNGCLAKVTLQGTPPQQNPPVIESVTPQNDSEWIGPVSCSVRNPYNFSMYATDADGALDITNTTFEMNRGTSGTPQVKVQLNKSSGSNYTLTVGSQTATLSPPRVRTLYGRNVWMFILRSDLNVTLQGGYPLTVIGANGNESDPNIFSYIAYEVGNPTNVNLWTNLRVKFNDSAGNNWNNGGYTFNNRWTVKDTTNQSDTELRGKTRIDFVKPTGSYTSVTPNGNIYTLNYSGSDPAGGSGLAKLAGNAEHLNLIPENYYSVQKLDSDTSVPPFTYSLNSDSQTGGNELWGVSLSGSSTTTGSRRIQFNVQQSGTINYKMRVTDQACNFADVSTNQQVSTGWLMSRGGLVFSGGGINTPIPNFSNSLELPAFTPATSVFPFDFTKMHVNIGTELVSIGTANPLKEIRNYIGSNGYYSTKNYSDANNKLWYADLKKAADNNAVVKPDRFDKKSFNTVNTLSGNISQLCTDQNKVCVATLAGSVTTSGLTCDRKAILFINGSLILTNTQAGSKHVSSSGGINGCIFVVKNNVTIEAGASGSGDPYYDTVEAFVIADGNIVINPDPQNNGLKIWGGLLSFANSGQGVDSARVLTASSANNYPALALHHDPRYIEIASGLFEELAIYKRETGYKP